MRTGKTLLLAVLLLTMVLLVVACGTPTETTSESTPQSTTPLQTTTTTAVTTTSTPVTTEAPLPTKLTSLKIGDVDIAQYKIVYRQSEYTQFTKISSTKRYFPVYDFDHETANRLAALIQEKLGVKLTVAEDKKTNEGEYEILIGLTNRTAVNTALGFSALTSDEYRIEMSGTKLAICGGEYGTTWHAIDYLEQLIETTLAERKTDLALAADWAYEGEHHLTRIGCIGDSITAGVGSSNSELFAYPAQLGRYLWKDALVTPFGNSGKTMRDDLNDSYYKTTTYTDAVNAASQMDIFTVMLGTNDSNRDRSWTGNDSTTYINDCIKILSGLTAKNDELEFVIANCPAYFGNDAYGSQTVRSVQKRMLTNLKDAGFTVSFFDMFSVTEDMENYFPDSLHPNDMGHMKMAEAFSAHLQALIDGEYIEAE